MLRLRQMDSTKLSAIKPKSCIAYGTTDYTRYFTDFGNFKCNGQQQIVEDFYTPKAMRKRFTRIRRKLDVPPLNAVRMSKIEYPTHSELLKYKYSDAVWNCVAEGPPVALAPLARNLDFQFQLGSPQLTVVDLNVYSYLLQRAYSKMSTAEYDFGVTIGEVAETAAFLAKPLAGIAKLSHAAFAGYDMIKTHGVKTYGRVSRQATARQLRLIRDTSVAHPVNSSLRVLDESANHWLAYKFGVLPMIDDVKKAMEFHEENILGLTGLRVARVGGWITDTTAVDLAKDRYYTGNWYLSYLLVKRCLDQHHVGLYFRNKVTTPLVNFVENIGFAPWQLPSLAWELIPLSFVADRFIDIKSFVRGNIGGLSKDTFGSFCTRKITTTYATTVHKFCWGGQEALVKIPPGAETSLTRYTQMARQVNLDRPNFPVINPHWREMLTADATNLALIWGRLRTHVSKQF